jgi:hypothetical protein
MNGMLNSKQLLVIYDVLVEHCSMLTANKEVHETKEHVRNMILKNINESDKLKLDLWIKSQEQKMYSAQSSEQLEDEKTDIMNDDYNEISKNIKYPRRPPNPVMPKIRNNKR